MEANGPGSYIKVLLPTHSPNSAIDAFHTFLVQVHSTRCKHGIRGTWQYHRAALMRRQKGFRLRRVWSERAICVDRHPFLPSAESISRAESGGDWRECLSPIKLQAYTYYVLGKHSD